MSIHRIPVAGIDNAFVHIDSRNETHVLPTGDTFRWVRPLVQYVFDVQGCSTRWDPMKPNEVTFCGYAEGNVMDDLTVRFADITRPPRNSLYLDKLQVDDRLMRFFQTAGLTALFQRLKLHAHYKWPDLKLCPFVDKTAEKEPDWKPMYEILNETNNPNNFQ